MAGLGDEGNIRRLHAGGLRPDKARIVGREAPRLRGRRMGDRIAPARLEPGEFGRYRRGRARGHEHTGRAGHSRQNAGGDFSGAAARRSLRMHDQALSHSTPLPDAGPEKAIHPPRAGRDSRNRPSRARPRDAHGLQSNFIFSQRLFEKPLSIRPLFLSPRPAWGAGGEGSRGRRARRPRPSASNGQG